MNYICIYNLNEDGAMQNLLLNKCYMFKITLVNFYSTMSFKLVKIVFN